MCINCYGMDNPPLKPQPHVQSGNLIITIESIAEFISRALELSKSEKVLVVFDIDDVLIRRERRSHAAVEEKYDPLYLQLGAELWRGMQSLKMSGVGSACATGFSPDPIQMPRLPSPESRWEVRIPADLTRWVNHLTTVTDVICLTMRGFDSRANLRQLGINLMTPGNCIEPESSRVEALSSHGSTYRDNIIYTDHNPKGTPLLDFYRWSSGDYDRVLFVDNIRSNVEDVVSTLSGNGVNIIGFWLSSDRIGECDRVEPGKSKSRPFFYGTEDDSDDDQSDTGSSGSWPDLT